MTWKITAFEVEYEKLLDDGPKIRSFVRMLDSGDRERDISPFFDVARLLVLNGCSQLDRRMSQQLKVFPWRLLGMLGPMHVFLSKHFCYLQ